jgi:hypothetical protein
LIQRVIACDKRKAFAQGSEATKQSILSLLSLRRSMDCFARNDVAEISNTPSRSRGSIRPSFSFYFPPSPFRGRRECRVHAAPAVSCASCTENAHTSIQVQRRQSDIPCAMVLRFPSCSPRRSGFLVTVAGAVFSADLNASVEASGPHDFAVRLKRPRQKHRQRPPHPAPRP